MIDERERYERAFQQFQMTEPAWEILVDRRDRKRRNQRIMAGVVGIAVFVAAIWIVTHEGWLDRSEVPADPTSSRFVDTWTSTELYSGSSQTMTIRPAEDRTLDITLHDDSSFLCSDRQTRLGGVDTPSTMTGTGRLEDATTLVVPSPVLACADGREASVPRRDETVQAPDRLDYWEEGGSSYTLVLDLATDRLFDNLGVAWHRGATLQNRTDTMTECETEEWGSTPPGTCSMLGGEVTFHADQPWESGNDSVDPRLFYLPGPDDASIEILANPNPLPKGPCYLYPLLPTSAEALVQAIRSNPDLEVTVPVAERVGGIDALQMDVAPVPGASTCPNGGVPVVSTSNSGWGTMGPAELGRLYVLDLPGGSARTLVIMINASEAAFERAVEAAAPVVESFEFHAG
jgi:hypothetical protein